MPNPEYLSVRRHGYQLMGRYFNIKTIDAEQLFDSVHLTIMDYLKMAEL